MSRLLPRLSYANVLSSVAVFLALGGGGFAVASHLNVRASDIKKNAVRAKHIKKKAVKSPKIANGAVRPSKLAPNARTLWAVVSSSGNLLRGRGAVDADSSSVGNHEVAFNRNVANCSAQATSVHTTPEAITTATTAPGSLGPNEVRVRQVFPSGTAVGVEFYVAVFC